MNVQLNFSKEELDLMREVMFEHKVALKRKRNKSNDREEVSILNDQINTIEMEILPKLGDC